MEKSIYAKGCSGNEGAEGFSKLTTCESRYMQKAIQEMKRQHGITKAHQRD